MAEKYLNQYEVKVDCAILHISGLKHEASLILDKDDYETVSKVHWGLMAVGRDPNKKVVPYTIVNRHSVPLGRWLLNVYHSEKRVEHIDRNNHNFLRKNLYVAGKFDYRRRFSLKEQGRICGVYEIKRKDGRIDGYKVEYKDSETNQKRFMCFTARHCNGLEKARKEAYQFRMRLLFQNEMHIA